MFDDLGETIHCPNCGRPNPGWAQLCRNCGLSLRHVPGRAPRKTDQPIPTDQASLLSMGAAVGAIVVAIVLGVIFSNLNPTAPTVGISQSPTPAPTVPVFSPSEAATPSPTVSVAPTPSPTPKLPATITFGSGLTASKTVTGKTNTFGPGSYFAHSIQSSQPFGTTRLYETVVRVASDGTETAVQTRYPVIVSAQAKVVGFVVATNGLLQDWGQGGTYVMRVYKGQTLFAQGTFKLTTG